MHVASLLKSYEIHKGCGVTAPRLRMNDAPSNTDVMCPRVSRCANAAVYVSILRWVMRLFGKPLTAGKKALIFRHYLISARVVNVSTNVLVDAMDIFEFLRASWSDEHRTLGDAYGMPAECVGIVTMLKLFRRSYVPQRLEPFATTAYAANGRITYVTPALRDLVHDNWKRILEGVARVRQNFSTRMFSRGLADANVLYFVCSENSRHSSCCAGCQESPGLVR